MEHDNDDNRPVRKADTVSVMRHALIDCIWSAEKLLNQLKSGELIDDNTRDNGISLLDLKNKMFLSYLLDITGVAKNRLAGNRTDSEPVLERLAEQRVVLEKIRPIEDKLRYQIDMLMKTLAHNDAGQSSSDGTNPLALRPNFDIEDNGEDKKDLADDDAEADDDDEPKLQGEQKYVPPRLAQMKYEDDQERRVRNLQHAKKRAMNSSIMTELRREFDDAPEEEYDRLPKSSGIGKLLQKKKRYEEDNFIRLNLTKRQKAQARRVATVNSIGDDVTRFEDISALDIERADDFQPDKRPRNSGTKTKKKQGRKRNPRRR